MSTREAPESPEHDATGTDGLPARLARLAVWAVPVLPLLSSGVPLGEPWTYDRFEIVRAATLVALACAGGAAWLVARAGGLAAGRTRRALWLLPAVAAAIAASALFGLAPGPSLLGAYGRWDGAVPMLAGLVLCHLAFAVLDTPARVRVLARVIAACGGIAGAYGLAQYAGFDPVRWGSFAFGDRVHATMGNPDLLAGWLALAAGPAIALALGDEERLRPAWWACAAAVAGGVTVTFVRAGWIGAAVTVAVLAVAVVRLGVRPGRSAIAGAAVCALLVAGLAAGSLGSARPETDAAARAASVLTAIAGGDQRVDIFDGALRAVAARPVLGSGPDTFRLAFGRWRGEGFTRRWGSAATADDAHDRPLQLAAGIGVPAALALYALFALALTSGARAGMRAGAGEARLPAAGLVAGMGGALVASLALPVSPAVSALMLACAGALLGMGAARRTAPATAVPGPVAFAACLGALAVAIWAGSWLVADAQHRAGVFASDGDTQLARYAEAARTNPLVTRYAVEYAAALAIRAGEQGARGTGEGLETARAAEAVYLEAARLSPFDMDVRRGLARLTAQMAAGGVPGYERRAADAARDAADISPTDPASQVIWSLSLLRTGETTAALQAARRAAGLDPRWAEARIAVADALRVRGDIAGARAAYREALRLDPGNAYATEQLRAVNGTGTVPASP